MIKLSVIIITRNEEKNIRNCLESVKWADEIVVVDQSSTDKTVDICKLYTDRVFIVEAKGYCEPDRMVAISKTRGEWILYIDTDERVSPELKNEILTTISSEMKGHNCYYLPRKTHFLGRWIKGCGWYPGYVLRLFKKGTVIFSDRIHQDGTAKEECGCLRNDLIHLSYQNLEDYFEKFNRYTSRLAQEKYERSDQTSSLNFWVTCMFKPLFYFLRSYFLQKGWRDGFRGFFISFSSGLVIFVTYAKVWEFLKTSKKDE
jgi:glycosyltransferase involved in cell wall biosynthesis